MTKIKLKKNKGFVILFAVTLAAIILSITFGVASIAQKEIKFGTSAKDTNEAFFAADTGAECALVNDKSTGSAFVTGTPVSFTCNKNLITANEIPASSSIWKFTVLGLGSGGQGCAIVIVNKNSTKTAIVSKGYNIGSSLGCNSTNSNLVERELDLN